MDKKLEKIVQDLQERFGSSIEEFRDEVHVFVKAEQIVEALTLLRDKHEFELLSAQTASDYWPQMTPRFHVIYQLTSLAKNLSVQLRVPVDGDQPKVPTATRVYEVANWRERELMDMFGIEAAGQRRQSVVVVQYGTMRAGLVVDNLLGEFQTVIKPLGSRLQGTPGLAGATITGDGRIALILDLPTLIRHYARRNYREVA